MSGFRKLLNIPDSIIPFALIPIGWPDEDFVAKDSFRPDLIHHETWEAK